jgi:hypothetical protein
MESFKSNQSAGRHPWTAGQVSYIYESKAKGGPLKSSDCGSSCLKLQENISSHTFVSL